MTPRGTCPICGRDTGAVKNHVRMASGDGHGPPGQYPDAFDREARTDVDGPERSTNLKGETSKRQAAKDLGTSRPTIDRAGLYGL